ncbi:MAG: hypothetical protein AAFQ42_09500 [Pseudomonadota bacterium]
MISADETAYRSGWWFSGGRALPDDGRRAAIIMLGIAALIILLSLLGAPGADRLREGNFDRAAARAALVLAGVPTCGQAAASRPAERSCIEPDRRAAMQGTLAAIPPGYAFVLAGAHRIGLVGGAQLVCLADGEIARQAATEDASPVADQAPAQAPQTNAAETDAVQTGAVTTVSSCVAPGTVRVLRLLGVLAALGALALAFATAVLASGAWTIAGLTALLVSLAGALGRYGVAIRGEIFLILFVFAGILLLLRGLGARKASSRFACHLGAGFTFSVAGLFAPIWLAAVPLAAVASLLAVDTHRHALRDRALDACLIAAGAAAGLAMASTALPTTGHLVSASETTLAFDLAARSAFTDLKATTYLAGVIYWLPQVGDTLAAFTLPASSFAPLVPGSPNYYVAVGHIGFAADVAAGDAQGISAAFADLVSEPLFWLATSALLFLKAVSVSAQITGMFGLGFVARYAHVARARRRTTPAIAVVGLTLAMTIVIAAFSPATLQLAAPLVLGYALVVAERFGAL